MTDPASDLEGLPLWQQLLVDIGLLLVLIALRHLRRRK